MSRFCFLRQYFYTFFYQSVRLQWVRFGTIITEYRIHDISLSSRGKIPGKCRIFNIYDARGSCFSSCVFVLNIRGLICLNRNSLVTGGVSVLWLWTWFVLVGSADVHGWSACSAAWFFFVCVCLGCIAPGWIAERWAGQRLSAPKQEEMMMDFESTGVVSDWALHSFEQRGCEFAVMILSGCCRVFCIKNLKKRTRSSVLCIVQRLHVLNSEKQC